MANTSTPPALSALMPRETRQLRRSGGAASSGGIEPGRISTPASLPWLRSGARSIGLMRDAVIVGAVRTPVGRRKGGLAHVHPVDLSAHVLTALAERTGFDPGRVEDVIWGCVSQVGDQAFNVARSAVLAAGWPESVPGTTLDRQCGSSQQAVHFAAAAVIAGQAELVAARLGFSRRQLDEYSLDSHARAAAADFSAEIVPVDGVSADEGIRRDTSLEKLAELPTPFRPDGVVTAGSSSQISDGAAALAITTSEWATAHGLRPLARIHTAVVTADDPVIMLTAVIPATALALGRAGLQLSDIGVYEVNEAFAPVPLAWLAETGADPAQLNPRGGAIALGHPLGGSGARIMTTLLHSMRDHGIRYGLQTMCEGGGMANATVLELVE